MKIKEIIAKNLAEIGKALALIKEEETDQFIKRIFSSKRVFVAGAGRSGILIRAFATRLMQMGFSTYVVGETITPAIGEDDLLVLMSGSGETEYSYHVSKAAQGAGAHVYLITAHKGSRMWKMAQGKIKIPGPTKLSSLEKHRSRQVLGSLFEQGAFIFLECVVDEISKEIKMHPEDIMVRHTNLE
ncbi:MAG: 6-phospho-3-hexuloisomerase [bacterium]